MVDPRTPVVVGVGVADQHEDDPAQLVEAVALMIRAAEAAIADSGASGLGAAVDLIAVPEGNTSYRDPGRIVGEAISAAAPTTVLAKVGLVQQDLFTVAAERIASGDIEVALIVGGEAQHRSVRGRVTETVVETTQQADDVHPDLLLEPATLGFADIELIQSSMIPTVAYPLLEHARMHALGRSPEEHAAAIGALYESFAAVAQKNPHAWDSSPRTADEIVTPTAANRMISTPYTKVLCSQWNVDQAAAAILCSAEAAARAGIAEDRWVFLHGATVSNHSVPVLQRPSLHRSVGAEVAARRVLELAGIDAHELGHIDLYSCFPMAVQVFADALGLSLPGSSAGSDRPLTVTGGMSFAGGPLNNYVLQAFAELVTNLRRDRGSFGLSSSVSVNLNKQAFSVWSTTPPSDGPFPAVEDVTAEAADAEVLLPIVASFVGPATIVSWTVEHRKGEPHRAVVILDVESGRERARTVASTGDAAVAEAMLTGDWIGRPVEVKDDGSFLLT